MSKLFLYISLFTALFVSKINGKIFNNCELATTLLNNGVPREQLGEWVCIAEHESNFNTQAVNSNTGDYGIFQISGIYWCNDGDTPGKACQITCQSLLDDDISNDITCAKQVYSETESQKGCGFCAWVAYNQHCSSGGNEQYINGCNI